MSQDSNNPILPRSRGNVAGRLANLQNLRQQAQRQGFRTRNRGSQTKSAIGDISSWYKGLNSDRKVALASISLLLLLMLSMGVIALTGGFQDTQGQINQNNPVSDNSTVLLSTPTSAPTPTSVPTATATPQATPTQQPIYVPQPTVKPVPTPKPTPTPLPKPTPTVVATPTPRSTPTPTPVNDQAPKNPWGYDFNPGQTITSPPTQFCSYFTCVDRFQGGTGYIVKCNDGLYSLTGGTANACAGDGGIRRTLYSHG